MGCFGIGEIAFSIARTSENIPIQSSHIHQSIHVETRIGVQIALIGRTAGGRGEGITTRLAAGTPHGRFLGRERAQSIETRSRSVEHPDVVVHGEQFFIVHNRDADIASIETARGKGILHQSAFGELHRCRRIDLRSVEVHLVLPELHVSPGQLRVGEVDVEEGERARRLRILGGLRPHLDVVFEIRVEEMAHEVKPQPADIEGGRTVLRPVGSIVAEYAQELGKVLRLAGISPGIVTEPLSKPELGTEADLEEEGIVVHRKIKSAVVPPAEGRRQQLRPLLGIFDNLIVLLLCNHAALDRSFEQELERGVHAFDKHILAVFFDQLSGVSRLACSRREQPGC